MTDLDNPGAVTGSVTVFLPKRDPVGRFLRYQLVEQNLGTDGVVIAASPYHRIGAHPVLFTLSYPRTVIDPDRRYLLRVTLTEDVGGLKRIAQRAMPVLTHHHPARVAITFRVPAGDAYRKRGTEP